LEILRGRIVLLPCEGGTGGGLVLARLPVRVCVELVVETNVVARVHRVPAEYMRVGRLKRINRVLGIACEVVADIVNRVEQERGEMLGPAEECGHGRRESQRRGIEDALVLPYVGLLKALPSDPDVPQGVRRLDVGVVNGDAVVLSEQIVPARNDVID